MSTSDIFDENQREEKIVVDSGASVNVHAEHERSELR